MVVNNEMVPEEDFSGHQVEVSGPRVRVVSHITWKKFISEKFVWAIRKEKQPSEGDKQTREEIFTQSWWEKLVHFVSEHDTQV